MKSLKSKGLAFITGAALVASLNGKPVEAQEVNADAMPATQVEDLEEKVGSLREGIKNRNTRNYVLPASGDTVFVYEQDKESGGLATSTEFFRIYSPKRNVTRMDGEVIGERIQHELFYDVGELGLDNILIVPDSLSNEKENILDELVLGQRQGIEDKDFVLEKLKDKPYSSDMAYMVTESGVTVFHIGDEISSATFDASSQDLPYFVDDFSGDGSYEDMYNSILPAMATFGLPENK